MYYTKLASAAINDIYSGLAGLHHNLSLSIELLEDELALTRLLVIKEYLLKGILPLKDLLIAINCIPVDCKDLERCPACCPNFGTPLLHFEIPQLVNDYGAASLAYVGSPDRMNPFIFYITPDFSTFGFTLYRKRGKDKPYVYIDPTPNENNMYDGYIWNAPFMETISVVGVFKDLRLLEGYNCCLGYEDPENYNFIDIEVKNRLVLQKINYYRLLHMNKLPNDQLYT